MRRRLEQKFKECCKNRFVNKNGRIGTDVVFYVGVAVAELQVYDFRGKSFVYKIFKKNRLFFKRTVRFFKRILCNYVYDVYRLRRTV